jgi:hypothetical protein
VFSAVGYTRRGGAPANKGNNGYPGKLATTVSGTCWACNGGGGGVYCVSGNKVNVVGKSGCGGLGGAPGNAGKGGGSSIAVFVWDAKVDITGGALTAGDGGDGGKGTAGAEPSAPTTGSDESKQCAAACEGQGQYSCQLSNAKTLTSYGTTGGKGTAGGRGGDGAGGFAYAIYKGGTGSTVDLAGVALQVGSPGLGGANGVAATKNF